jgi:hypothetical protein
MNLLKTGSGIDPTKWYFAVVCHGCRQDINIAEAPSVADEKVPLVHGVRARCSSCQTKDGYSFREVKRRRPIAPGGRPSVFNLSERNLKDQLTHGNYA